MATADRDEVRRMVIKTGTGIATIPVSSDHRNGDWLDTDIYNGEYYMDTATGLIYTANADVIQEVGPPASAGLFGIATAGVYTYYTTIALANTAASSGDTIEMFGNVTEAGTTEWILKDGVNYNLNGGTYEMTNAGTNNAITDNAVSAACTIFNGTIKRSGGTSSLTNSLGLHIDHASSVINLQAVDVVTTFGCATTCDGLIIGGRHFGNASAGMLIYGEAREVYAHSSGSHGLYVATTEIMDCKGYSDGGAGIYLSNACKAVKCYGYSTASNGIQDTGAASVMIGCTGFSIASYGINGAAAIMKGCHGYSTGGIGIGGTGSVDGQITDCTAYSTSSNAFHLSGVTGKTYGCTGESTAAAAIFCRGSLYKCTAICSWNNSTGHAVSATSTQMDEIFDCMLTVTHASANCIYYGSAINVLLGRNTYNITPTTPVNANITNTQANAEDAYGNMQIG